MTGERFNRPHDRHHIVHKRYGPDPRLGFISLLHGDEGGVVKPLSRGLNFAVMKDPLGFPDHIAIFKANPPAANLGHRKFMGKDLNREFKKKGGSWQKKEILEIFSSYPDIEYLFSFHEETDKKAYQKVDGKIVISDRNKNAFYMYDAYDPKKENISISEFLGPLRRALIDSRFSLYDGFDDYKKFRKENVQLNKVKQGYCLQTADSEKFIDGTLENWVVAQGMKRSFTFEIPAHISEERKQLMMQIIFQTFIIPFLNRVYQ